MQIQISESTLNHRRLHFFKKSWSYTQAIYTFSNL